MSASDQKLLELAAKACGMPPPYDKHGVFSAWVGSPDHGHWWDPLTDDGDALRLAVKLKIEIAPQTFAMSRVDVRTKGDRWIWEQYSNHGEDAQKATRRAIVRAAAEIGRAKQ